VSLCCNIFWLILRREDGKQMAWTCSVFQLKFILHTHTCSNLIWGHKTIMEKVVCEKKRKAILYDPTWRNIVYCNGKTIGQDKNLWLNEPLSPYLEKSTQFFLFRATKTNSDLVPNPSWQNEEFVILCETRLVSSKCDE
jgi:hypothetical protein